MPEEHSPAPAESLSFSHEEAWTLHDVLRRRLDRDTRGEREDGQVNDRLRAAFERLDGGGRRFTHPQLDAMQRALSRAHHRRQWEVERPQLEALLHRVTRALDREPERENTGG